MKPSDLSEFFSLLGKAKKEKEEEFDNLLKEADINLDDLTSSLVSGIKEAKDDQKKQKKNEEKLIEQLDSIINVIENPKEVKDITEPAVTVGVPEDFDISKLEEEDVLDVQDWNDGKDVKFTEVDAVDIIKPEPIKTPEINDTVAQAIKFIEETNIKEEIENSDDTNLDKLKTEIKQVRDILYKVLAHGPGSGEVRVLRMDDVDITDLGDEKVLSYDASSEKLKFVEQSGGSGVSTENVRTGILDVAGIATFRNDTLVGSGITLSPDGDVFVTGVTTATKFVGDGSGLTGITASGSGVVVQDEGSAIGTAATINFIGSNVTAALSGGIANVTVTPGITTANVRTGILDVAGISTFRNDTLIGSGVTLSPDGDVFATGVTTSSSFVGDLTGDVTGTASNATQLNSQAASYYLNYNNFSNTPTIPSNNNQLTNGASFITASDDITGNAATSTKLATARTIAGVSFDGSANISLNNNAITNGAGYITTSFTNTNQLTNGASFITASDDITGNAATATILSNARTIAGVSFNGSANISLNNNAITNGAGYITGSALNASNLSSGTIPDARFPSTLPAIDGSSLTGIAVTDNIRTNTNATFLQNVNVSGTTTATTFIGNLTGNVTGNVSGTSGSTTGNAATATKLAATKTIAGVAFDGSANISLNNNAITNGAGYITATLTDEEVQDKVGAMFSSNTETGITATYQDADGTIDLVVGTLNQDTTGNAATATALETARNIGGVSFDGSANIDLPGVNSAGNQNTTGTSAGLTGTPSITVNAVNGATGTFSGNVTIGGVLTYEDVTNVDSVGVITARSGVLVGSGITLSPDGDGFYTGIVTASSFVGGLPITNGADNRVITATSASAIQGEAGLTFDGTTLTNAGSGFKGITIAPNTNNSATLRLQNSQANFSVSNITGGSFSIAHGSDTRFTINSSGTVGINNDLETTSDVKVGSGITLSPDGDIFAVGVSTFVGNFNIRPSNGQSTPKISYDDSITDALIFQDNVQARFGESSDLRIYHSGSHSYIDESGTGNLYIRNGSKNSIFARSDGEVILYHNDSSKFKTAETGAVVTGILTATSNVNVGSGITLSSDGDVFATGVTTSTTFVGALTGNVTGNASGSSGSCTGNAATATALETARTIAGVSFDGSANISLNNNAITNGAGYITATLTDEQVQDVVGAMFSSNTETGITATYQDADGTIDLVVGTSSNATALETARTIGGTSFDGTANIVPAEATNADTVDSLHASSFIRSDADDSFTGTLTAASDGSNPVIKIQGGGPNFIQFASDNSGTVDADSINLIYRLTPNTLGYERASDDTVLFSIDADNAAATFGGDSTFSGSLTIGDGSAQTELLIKKADDNVSDHLQFYNGTTRVGEIGVEDTNWLRINQETNTNIYTPRMIRADGGFNVDNSVVIDDSGNIVASKVPTLNQDTTGTAALAEGLTGTPNIACGTGSFTGDLSVASDIVHTGDTDTSIGFAGNTIKFNTAGSERLRINSSGRVGIGTDNPTAEVTISSSSPEIHIIDSDVSRTTKVFNSNGNLYLQSFDADRDVIIRGDTSENARFTGDGRLGVGINAPKTDVDISNDAGGTLTLSCSDDSSSADQLIGKLNFYTSDPSGDGPQNAAHISAHSFTSTGSGAYLKFSTATGATGSEGADAVERLRIDANGNIGINAIPRTSGTIVDNTEHFLVIGDTDTGIAQDGDGELELWANNQEIVNLNTTGVTFTKDLTIPDKIIHSGDANTAIRFPANDVISFETVGVERARFTSNGLCLGGTGSANGLDDYEEGTFTPSYSSTNSNVSGVTYDARTGRYTKIGRFCFITIRLRTDAISIGSGTIRITGLPFTHVNQANGRAVSNNLYTANWKGDSAPTQVLIQNNQTYMNLYQKQEYNDTTALSTSAFNTTSNDNDIRLTAMYETTA